MRREVKVIDGKPYILESDGSGRPTRWREAIWRECWSCGQKFPFPIRFISEESRNKGHFCSFKCNGKWRKKYYLSKRTKKRCVICLEFFSVPPSQAKRIKTCSKPECTSALLSRINKEKQKKSVEARMANKVR